MPARGDFARFNRLIERINELPGATPKVAAAVAPTVAKLLVNRRSEVGPRHIGRGDSARFPERKYEVSADVAERIASNTHVWSEGTKVRVHSIATDERAKHLRPIYPIGDSMPIRWNRAIFAKANGEIRRLLKG